VAPNIDEVITGADVTLSWTASDVDNDALTYDVYLDTEINPVAKVSENQTETTFNVTNLISGTTYYFKVVVKDNNGGVTVGQVWRFITQ
jgi:fibronectin type 3 domain-containing protein